MPLRKYIPAKQRAQNTLRGDTDKPKLNEAGSLKIAKDRALATLSDGKKVPLSDLETEKARLKIILDKKKEKLLEAKKAGLLKEK